MMDRNEIERRGIGTYAGMPVGMLLGACCWGVAALAVWIGWHMPEIARFILDHL